jgi:hypothetical protein
VPHAVVEREFWPLSALAQYLPKRLLAKAAAERRRQGPEPVLAANPPSQVTRFPFTNPPSDLTNNRMP